MRTVDPFNNFRCLHLQVLPSPSAGSNTPNHLIPPAVFLAEVISETRNTTCGFLRDTGPTTVLQQPVCALADKPLQLLSAPAAVAAPPPAALTYAMPGQQDITKQRLQEPTTMMPDLGPHSCLMGPHPHDHPCHFLAQVQAHSSSATLAPGDYAGRLTQRSPLAVAAVRQMGWCLRNV
jgi:hypothetical protein